MMKLHEACTKAAALLSKKGTWVKGDMAVDRNGGKCDWDSPEATKFCMLGAICRCAGENLEHAACAVSPITLHRRLFGGLLTVFNDSPTRQKKDVITRLKVMARVAKKEGL